MIMSVCLWRCREVCQGRRIRTSRDGVVTFSIDLRLLAAVVEAIFSSVCCYFYCSSCLNNRFVYNGTVFLSELSPSIKNSLQLKNPAVFMSWPMCGALSLPCCSTVDCYVYIVINQLMNLTVTCILFCLLIKVQ